jgi:leucyl/phenylalanyl-tRNA---protein transferase
MGRSDAAFFAMAIFLLDKQLVFPPPHLAEPDGLLAVGGDLSTERLLVAYRSGIFPWYEGEHILWWCPDPRFVLFPDKLRISKSMRTIIKRGDFEFRTNTSFREVVQNCQKIERRDQTGTWITSEVLSAYQKLHEQGFAHCAEAWKDGQLVGGLYGVKLGHMFFGESMFSKCSNASKFAFIEYVRLLNKEGIVLIDCQVYTEHLESLGAEMIARAEFLEMLKREI